VPAEREDRNIYYLVLQTAIVGVLNGGTGTFISVYLARIGASGLVVSLLTAAPALVTILMSLPSGSVTARQRDLVRYTAIAFGFVRSIHIFAALAAFAQADVAAGLIVLVWALSAIPSTLANTGWYDVMADAMSPRRRPMVNGVRWSLLGLFSGISVAVFGAVLDALPFPLGYQVVFLVSFIAGMMATWYYSRIEIPEKQPAGNSVATGWRSLVAELARPLTESAAFRQYVAACTVLRIGLFLPIGLFSVFWVNDLHATNTLIGLRTTVGNAALTVGYFAWGRAAVRLGPRRGLALAAGGLALYPLLTGLAPTPEWLFPAALVWGAFASGIDMSLFEGILEVSPADRRAQYVAMNTFIANTVALTAPVLGAVLAAASDIRVVMFTSSALHVATVFIVLWMALRTGWGSTRPAAHRT
jgi:MFS family permease